MSNEEIRNATGATCYELAALLQVRIQNHREEIPVPYLEALEHILADATTLVRAELLRRAHPGEWPL